MTSTSTANAVLEAARYASPLRNCPDLTNYAIKIRDIKSPIIIQVSQGGSAFFAGKGLANDKQQASIVGAVSAAHHIRLVAKSYGMCVMFWPESTP